MDLIYLYGRGSKKHIACSPSAKATFCGASGMTEQELEKMLYRWSGPVQAERFFQQDKAKPTCKVCQNAWDRADHS